MTHPLSLSFNSLRCPALQESKHLFFVIPLTFFQEAGILDMENLSGFIEHHKDRESETLRIVQSLHQLLSLLHSRITGSFSAIVVHMNIFEMIIHHLVDRSILLYKIGKLQAPWTPVTPYLTDNKLAILLALAKASSI